MPHPKQIDLHLCPVGTVLLQKEYPPEASKAGRNTVYHSCEVYGGRPSYASCLFTLDAIAEGRDNLRPHCAEAVRNGTCVAVQMQKDEQAAGRALFFVDYLELTEARRAQWAKDLEESPIQFRRRDRKEGVRWKTTEVKPMEVIEAMVPSKVAPKKENLMDQEIDTNIFEQLVKHKVGIND